MVMGYAHEYLFCWLFWGIPENTLINNRKQAPICSTVCEISVKIDDFIIDNSQQLGHHTAEVKQE